MFKSYSWEDVGFDGRLTIPRAHELLIVPVLKTWKLEKQHRKDRKKQGQKTKIQHLLA